jgi:hypothetical protein
LRRLCDSLQHRRNSHRGESHRCDGTTQSGRWLRQEASFFHLAFPTGVQVTTQTIASAIVSLTYDKDHWIHSVDDDSLRWVHDGWVNALLPFVDPIRSRENVIEHPLDWRISMFSMPEIIPIKRQRRR